MLYPSLLFDFDLDNALDNQLALKNGCTCHGYNLTYECTVVGRPSEITIWRGSALSNCQNNELSLLHRQFKTASTSCDNPSIVAMGRDTDNGSYTSQLTIMVTDDVIGKSVECAHYDNNITTTIGSLNITVTGI